MMDQVSAGAGAAWSCVSGQAGTAIQLSEALSQGIYVRTLSKAIHHLGRRRADIRVLSDGHLAADTLSRGQQKLVICGLKLAQGQLLSELGRADCTYLIDDLPSELDQQHSMHVCEALASMDAQVFITCVTTGYSVGLAGSMRI